MGEVTPEQPLPVKLVPPQPIHQQPAREWTAVILAVGLATSINCITIAVLLDALLSESPGLSENATQILTTAFGGMIGVLGSYIGYRSASTSRDQGQSDIADAAARGAAIGPGGGNPVPGTSSGTETWTSTPPTSPGHRPDS